MNLCGYCHRKGGCTDRDKHPHEKGQCELCGKNVWRVYECHGYDFRNQPRFQGRCDRRIERLVGKAS